MLKTIFNIIKIQSKRDILYQIDTAQHIINNNYNDLDSQLKIMEILRNDLFDNIAENDKNNNLNLNVNTKKRKQLDTDLDKELLFEKNMFEMYSNSLSNTHNIQSNYPNPININVQPPQNFPKHNINSFNKINEYTINESDNYKVKKYENIYNILRVSIKWEDELNKLKFFFDEYKTNLHYYDNLIKNKPYKYSLSYFISSKRKKDKLNINTIKYRSHKYVKMEIDKYEKIFNKYISDPINEYYKNMKASYL